MLVHSHVCHPPDAGADSHVAPYVERAWQLKAPHTHTLQREHLQAGLRDNVAHLEEESSQWQ